MEVLWVISVANALSTETNQQEQKFVQSAKSEMLELLVQTTVKIVSMTKTDHLESFVSDVGNIKQGLNMKSVRIAQFKTDL